ncbi:hypothetical protein HMPREF2955_14460 [Prevotella sp. HMSC073D09]|uniref:DUF6155 family protein n=1 Tax=Prevotella sp. HMSC073D09 TaxID=1739459 RepID=UPI0008A48830|nr:DUF6155 family protein [Prevotella sp. HMSC073D09]OFQ11747.1 hypothetical protein HMPREF2955_14460 [Prevotella sp. HMSC073D09]
MSKAKLKKHLLALSKEKIIGVVLDLYDARTEAKAYFEFYLKPDSSAELEKLRVRIVHEFFPVRGLPKNPSFAKCKKIVTDFAKMQASPDCVADLMLTVTEQGNKWALTYGYCEGAYEMALANSFARAMDFIFRNGLLFHFYERIERMLASASNGWGGDSLRDIYQQYR